MTQRLCFFLAAFLASFMALPAPAQNRSNDDLARKYDDALQQLKNAQDRKNELALEVETLKTQLADLKAQLQSAQTQAAQAASLQTQLDLAAAKTYDHRAARAAFEQFLKSDPALAARWRGFIAASSIPIERDAFGLPQLPPAPMPLLQPAPSPAAANANPQPPVRAAS